MSSRSNCPRRGNVQLVNQRRLAASSQSSKTPTHDPEHGLVEISDVDQQGSLADHTSYLTTTEAANCPSTPTIAAITHSRKDNIRANHYIDLNDQLAVMDHHAGECAGWIEQYGENYAEFKNPKWYPSWQLEGICTPQEWRRAGLLKKLDYAAYRAEFSIAQDYEWQVLTIEQAEALLEDVFSRYKKHETPKLIPLDDDTCVESDVGLSTAGLASYDENAIYVRPESLTMDVILHEAAHLLTSQYAPAHGEDFRKKLNVLFKRHAKIDLTLPVEAWSHKKLMEQLEQSYKDRLQQLGQAYSDAYMAKHKARDDLEKAQKKLDAIKEKIQEWQVQGTPKEERAALEKALWNQTTRMLPLEAALKQAEEAEKKAIVERSEYYAAARK